MHLFESVLSVPAEHIEFKFQGYLSWANFLLNPRRLRGSDFLMRWSQGVWSEERLVQAVNQTDRYFALPYGPSGTAPDDDVRASEQYFERLEQAGLNDLKRPDLLIFRNSDQPFIDQTVQELGGLSELPFTSESHQLIQLLLSHAVIAVECENSLWKAKLMPDYNRELKPQRRLGGQPGLKKNAVLPTVIMKEEDRERLHAWQQQSSVPIHIWHVFYDMAFGLRLDDAQHLIDTGKIEPTIQTFQAPGGATTRKVIYKFYHHYAYPLGESQEEPSLIAAHIVDKNGHILPYVKFDGGRLIMRPEAIQILDKAIERRT